MPKRTSKPARLEQGILTRWNISKPQVKTAAKDYGKPGRNYALRLYVAGSNVNSMHAITSLETFCADYLRDKVDIEVVDLYQQPHLAKQDGVVAVPCLVRMRPLPRTMYVGRMDDCRKLLLRLGIDPGKLTH